MEINTDLLFLIGVMIIIVAYETLRTVAFAIFDWWQGRKIPVPEPAKPKIVPIYAILRRIDDPDKLDEALSKLTPSQYEEWKVFIERHKYRLNNLGTFLREMYIPMKKGDCRRQFIKLLVEKFKLFDQFGRVY